LEIPASFWRGRQKDRRSALPETALVVLVNKKDKFVIPSGGTVLEAGDRMMVLADQESIEVVVRYFHRVNPPHPWNRRLRSR
jgi:Trk K+ transport system NAD-binding subunit